MPPKDAYDSHDETYRLDGRWRGHYDSWLYLLDQGFTEDETHDLLAALRGAELV